MSDPKVHPPLVGTPLYFVELPSTAGVQIPGGPPGGVLVHRFRHEEYDLALASIFAPAMSGAADKGSWTGVIAIRKRNPNGEANGIKLVALHNVAGWELLTDKHTAPKSTANNTVAIAPKQGAR